MLQQNLQKKKKADDCTNFQFKMKDYVSRDKTKY